MQKGDEIFADGKRYKFKIGGRACAHSYETKVEAGKAYAKAFIASNGKFKPLVQGKQWSDIFRILGIDVK